MKIENEDLRAKSSGKKLVKVDSRPVRADLEPVKTDLRNGEVDLRPERDDEA